ncbi:MAG: hypothetical protein JWO46_3105 [Nocardioidaceae bacterium]|nr:hypothetical protein [Nocardioidaceae bacterium]
MTNEYTDTWIRCDENGVAIRGYYFPWGTKTIPYAGIRSARRIELDAFRGRLRIWGAGDPRYWFHLDPGRPSKDVGFVLDVGAVVSPVVTPDDPNDFGAVLRGHGVELSTEGRPGPRFA